MCNANCASMYVGEGANVSVCVMFVRCVCVYFYTDVLVGIGEQSTQ